MAIEIVDFPIKNGDFPWQNVSSPEGNMSVLTMWFGHPIGIHTLSSQKPNHHGIPWRLDARKASPARQAAAVPALEAGAVPPMFRTKMAGIEKGLWPQKHALFAPKQWTPICIYI